MAKDTMITVDELDAQARQILVDNDKGNYTIPTAGLYPYQWNWDSAFASVGFAVFDLDRAWTELDTLFSGQWDDGMVPHILFHTVDSSYFPGPDVWGGVGPIQSSGVTQPPVAATMALALYNQDKNVGQARAMALFEKMRAWHKWFMTWRLDKGAVCITHPWESGRDNAPDWDGPMSRITPVGVGEYTRRDTSHVDSAMRPTKDDYDRYIWLVQMGNRLKWDQAALLKENPLRVADPTMTFILLRAQRDLIVLGESLGVDVSDIEADINTLEAGCQSLWHEELGSFDARDARTGEWAGSISNASFLCWYAGIDVPAMGPLLDDIMRGMKFGVPSLDPRNERFDAKRYWRGPVWGMMNMMIGMGMAEYGMPQAEALRLSTAKLITENGFAEYFDPVDGSPAGGQSFTWTAAIWLAWASPSAGKS